MTQNEQKNSDILTLLLANAMHRDLPLKSRAIKIKRACKAIRDSTKDQELYKQCKLIIKGISNGQYQQAVDSIEITERNFSL